MANLKDFQMVKNMAEKLKNKNDEELNEEIKKLKSIMTEDDTKLKQQLQMIKPFREMLPEDQKKKFDIVMKALSE